MKQRLIKLALLGLALAAGGALLVLSGLVPIKASSGHWAVTEWLLHFAMKRSIATHSAWTDVPALDDPGLIIKGATHYESGCRWCHGAPGQPEPQVPQKMTPPPPSLGTKIAEWEAEELFYIVKHGVKFTGMPAWPSEHRDDEVWAMVAFLQILPDLDADRYRQLAFGDQRSLDACARCHAQDGSGRGAVPKLAGQRAPYLKNALEAYARGTRHSGIMQPIAAALTTEKIEELAEYYASLPAPQASTSSAATLEAIARGRELAERGAPEKLIPACAECHGPKPKKANPAFPILAGHDADYLVLQLNLLKSGARGGSSYLHLMEPIAKRMSDDQMREVALYYESSR